MRICPICKNAYDKDDDPCPQCEIPTFTLREFTAAFSKKSKSKVTKPTNSPKRVPLHRQLMTNENSHGFDPALGYEDCYVCKKVFRRRTKDKIAIRTEHRSEDGRCAGFIWTNVEEHGRLSGFINSDRCPECQSTHKI